MISSLLIQNFAIIDEVHIDFNDGMSVLTGETGAGKSIIIDAISLLMGARSNAFMVKSGQDKAFIEAVFTFPNKHPVYLVLSQAGFEVEDEIVISREITSDGKSNARLNYRHVSITLLKQLSSYIMDIHSQFETQYLLNDRIHLGLLDQYAGYKVNEVKESYLSAYNEYIKIKKEYDDLLSQPSDEEQIEYLQSKLDQIEEADLHEGDIDALEKEKKQMQNYEKSHAKLAQIVHLLKGDSGALEQLYAADHILSGMDEEDIEELQTKSSDLYFALNDLADGLESYMEDQVFDEYRYNEITNKLFLIHQLQRQYGYDEASILAKKEELEEAIHSIEHREEQLYNLETSMNQAYQSAYALAKQLHYIREQEALTLEQDILSELSDLYMQNVAFKVIFNEGNLTTNGFDQVSFYMSTNAGQALHKLSDIASGGELSRVMLGMKTIFAKLQNVPTIIFDEVDTGVSGKVAFAIGRKMKQLSADSQVLCITHLPQVASFASHHLYVSKETVQSTTKTKTTWLTLDERVHEIAKMLSNDEVNQAALDNARVLIEENNQIL